MTNIVKPSTIAGVMELLPDDQIAFDHIKTVIEDTFRKYQNNLSTMRPP